MGQKLFLPTVFETNNTNYIAECIVNEISIMIEKLALAKLVQCKKKYASWIDSNFLQQSAIRDKLHNKAIKSNRQEDWLDYWRQRNLVNRLNRDNKTNYYKDRLNKCNISSDQVNTSDSCVSNGGGDDGQLS